MDVDIVEFKGTVTGRQTDVDGLDAADVVIIRHVDDTIAVEVEKHVVFGLLLLAMHKSLVTDVST